MAVTTASNTPLVTPVDEGHARRGGRRRPISVARIVLHVVLIVGSVLMALPFLWMIFSAFKPLSEIFLQPPRLLPSEWQPSNFVDAVTGVPFAAGLWNSFYIAALVTILSLLTCAMAAYAFARIRFRGREPLFLVFLATMMIPAQMTIIPLYIIMGQLGWVDTHLSLLVPPILFNAFGVFLLRQYVRNIPVELEEAAAIDGASRARIFVTIILPLLRTPMAALGIFIFLAQWNNFFHPLIFLNTQEYFTLPLLVNQFKGQYSSDWTSLMAAATLAAAPLLIVFIIAQRHIVEGIALQGSKS
ncbi:carbohydrate ABC transporter permease [Desertihabitans aurantiacus]|uniref:carbohydrate ABC transporter permease n=1 Tax=Desertihabitans aurantiacus TaxID=2282477 RepID=UPI000DF82592|nr:carbohydrate ABC transporter permease [Desertihabitans aurantiacus]